MEKPGKRYQSAITLLASMLMVLVSVPGAYGQITTACTNSMISSFTPCLNYLTGSTNGPGSSPTTECCSSVRSLITSSTDCGCLILTGNVPFSLPINRTLSISLPRACKSASVPILQCKGSAAPLPAAGPIAFGPSDSGLPPIPSSGSDSASPFASPTPSPVLTAITPVAASPAANAGLHPVVIPSSAVKLPLIYSLSLLPLVLGALLVIYKF